MPVANVAFDWPYTFLCPGCFCLACLYTYICVHVYFCVCTCVQICSCTYICVHALKLIFHCIAIVKNKEVCPLKNCKIYSNLFDYDGGELLIKEHAVKVTIPAEAIDKGYKVQIEAAASLFGPFIIPEDYYPVSVYVWIGTCYTFKKKLEVEIEHNIVVSHGSEFSILTACEENICDGKDGQKLYKMHIDTHEYQCKIGDSTFTFFTDHFCSKCLATEKNNEVAKRVMTYHYLPEHYKSEKEFLSEVCFCYDLTCCKEVHTLYNRYA